MTTKSRKRKYVNYFKRLLRRKQFYMLDYVINWLPIIKRERLNVLRKLKMGFRFYPMWRQSLVSSGNPLADRMPWIPFEARYFIESLLRPESIVFEYGSGGSTLFFSERVKWVTSVEHDLNWFSHVKSALAEQNISNCDLLFMPPEATSLSNESIDDPGAYRSSGEAFRGYNFRRYVSLIDLFPDQFLDFVVIDGRARPSCILHAYRKVKIGRYLMLDDSDRRYYHRAKELLSDWGRHIFYGPRPYAFHFWETTVWRRIR